MELVQVVHDSQIAASLWASHLVFFERLTQLTTTPQELLENFNASAGLLSQGFLPQHGLTTEFTV